MNTYSNQDHLERMAEIIKKKNTIDPELYEKYDIRRGLRNKDQTGVLVGITRVGYVTGYEKVDGKKVPVEGDLVYRGYSVVDMVKDFQKEGRLGYEEIMYLLLMGELPTNAELDCFKDLIEEQRELPAKYLEDVILKIPSKNIMNKMMRAVLTLYSYDDDPESTDVSNILRQSISLMAKLPLIMAYSYHSKKHYLNGDSLVIHYPKNNASMAENILHLIRKEHDYTDLEIAVIDLMLTIHAEHGGGNNSTFATHVVSSTGTDTYSAIATGLGSLKGPRHGGANIMVADMLDDISDNIRSYDNREDIENYLYRMSKGEVFKKNGLIYGLGHAVYTLSDPRALLLKEQSRQLAKEKGYEDQFHFLELVEEIGGKILQEKNGHDYPTCANVDLYSGLVYEMMGIPRDLYTPMFAVARMAGWCAHRIEQIQDTKIIRPGYVNLCTPKKYIPLDKRTSNS